jgi:hypothetical protein
LKILFSLKIFVLLACISCGKKYNISSNDIKFNPYRGGEKLIFKSKNGNVKTVLIKKVVKSYGADDPLSVLPNKQQVLNVYVHFSDSIYNATLENLEGPFFSILALKDNRTIYIFSLNLGSANFYGNSYENKYINQMQSQTLRCGSKEYKDILVLRPNETKYKERSDYITTLYWSKSKGYVRYDLNNGEFWELQ